MEWPDGNPGIYPPDLASPVGQFRALTGDLNAEEYDPPVEGIRNYEMFSDAEIEAYLSQSEGSISRAIGFAYLYLAGQAAKESLTVRDYDLQVDSTKRAADLRAIAEMWFGRADDEDANAGAEAMVIVPVGPRRKRCRPEAAQYPLF